MTPAHSGAVEPARKLRQARLLVPCGEERPSAEEVVCRARDAGERTFSEAKVFGHLGALFFE